MSTDHIAEKAKALEDWLKLVDEGVNITGQKVVLAVLEARRGISDEFLDWSLAGVGAIMALLLTNGTSISHVCGEIPYGWSMGLISLGLLSGAVAKYMSSHLKMFLVSHNYMSTAQAELKEGLGQGLASARHELKLHGVDPPSFDVKQMLNDRLEKLMGLRERWSFRRNVRLQQKRMDNEPQFVAYFRKPMMLLRWRNRIIGFGSMCSLLAAATLSYGAISNQLPPLADRSNALNETSSADFRRVGKPTQGSLSFSVVDFQAFIGCAGCSQGFFGRCLSLAQTR